MRAILALLLCFCAATSSASEVVQEFEIPWTRIYLPDTRWYDRPSVTVMHEFKESGCSLKLKALSDSWDQFGEAAKEGRANMAEFYTLKKETFEAEKSIRLFCRGEPRFQTTGVSGK